MNKIREKLTRILKAKHDYEKAQQHFFNVITKGDGENIEDALLEYKRASNEYQRRVRR